ncbi:hypothetical protein D3C72_652870 [compost metagenome]
MRVVPALDPSEQCPACVIVRGEARTHQQLAFERGEEGLTHGVIVGIAHRAHRRLNTGVPATSPEGNRRVLAALIRVVNDILWAALRERHIQRLQHQRGTQMAAHGPAHNAPAVHIQHHCEIEEACCGRNVGRIGDPQTVRHVSLEVALHQIRSRSCARCSPRGLYPASPAHAAQARFTHQACHALAPDVYALPGQRRVNARHAIGAVRARVDGPDACQQVPILLCMGRWTALIPRMETAARDLKQPCHGRQGPGGLIRLHEFEPLSGTVPVSRANQAAAFANISRSILTCRSSLRRWVSSWRSAVLRPS